MTTRDEARAALVQARDWAKGYGGVVAMNVRLTPEQIDALLDEPVPTQGKTIADRIAFDAAVSNRAREIVNTRELFAAAQAASESLQGDDDPLENAFQMRDWEEVERILAERRSAPADELEALAKIISNSVMEDFAGSRNEADREGAHVARDVIAAGFRRQGPITDAMVEAAEAAAFQFPDSPEYPTFKDWRMARMRAALEAAREKS